ncbi:MAG: flagellar basal body P-ring protein FlgI [Phycisphaeraceae bacterium]
MTTTEHNPKDLRRTIRVRSCSFAALALSLLVASGAHAVQIQDIVRLKGAEGGKLVGMGLVVGLDGSGDGGDFRPAMRSLAEIVSQLMDPNVVASELANADNVAMVSLSADVPVTGVREGDRVDVHVASFGSASSLRGGRLFLIPMIGPVPGSPVYAFAEGPVTIEDTEIPTVGVVRNGAQLTRDVTTQYLNERGQITLVINRPNASWPVANNLASLINGLMDPDGPGIARAMDPKNVVVQVPEHERDNPASFISQILQTYIDAEQVAAEARVVINERTGTIVISGDVQVSPVIISHEGLTITTVTQPEIPGLPPQMAPEIEEDHFLAIDPENRAGAELADLLDAFNSLRVDAQDRIAILKLMHESGKLHGQLVIE